jgi:ferredoxin
MCEFCHKHGEGKKWYLQAKNYSDDLLADMGRRKTITDFFRSPGGFIPQNSGVGRIDAVKRRLPKPLRQVLDPCRRKLSRSMYCHQVTPIEDVERMFNFLGSVVRMPCLCRQRKSAKEQRYCYGLSLAPEGGEFFRILEGIDNSFINGADTQGLEKLSKEEALANFRQYELEGAHHAVYIFLEPFIAGICNCDRADCIPMQALGKSIMARSEYVATIDSEACNGCRACMRVCEFGALGYSMANKKVTLDQYRCFGCGICRASCAKAAIRLVDRASVPSVAGLWW